MRLGPTYSVRLDIDALSQVDTVNVLKRGHTMASIELLDDADRVSDVTPQSSQSADDGTFEKLMADNLGLGSSTSQKATPPFPEGRGQASNRNSSLSSSSSDELFDVAEGTSVTSPSTHFAADGTSEKTIADPTTLGLRYPRFQEPTDMLLPMGKGKASNSDVPSPSFSDDSAGESTERKKMNESSHSAEKGTFEEMMADPTTVGLRYPRFQESTDLLLPKNGQKTTDGKFPSSTVPDDFAEDTTDSEMSESSHSAEEGNVATDESLLISKGEQKTSNRTLPPSGFWWLRGRNQEGVSSADRPNVLRKPMPAGQRPDERPYLDRKTRAVDYMSTNEEGLTSINVEEREPSIASQVVNAVAGGSKLPGQEITRFDKGKAALRVGVTTVARGHVPTKSGIEKAFMPKSKR
jgi:hypothetical protein